MVKDEWSAKERRNHFEEGGDLPSPMYILRPGPLLGSVRPNREPEIQGQIFIFPPTQQMGLEALCFRAVLPSVRACMACYRLLERGSSDGGRIYKMGQKVSCCTVVDILKARQQS